MDQKARMESFFGTKFDDEDFVLTEEERMSIAEEEERLEALKLALKALRVRSDMSDEEYQRAARKIALKFLSERDE